jgi:hypothetical protein
MANPFKPDDKVLTLRKGIEIEATVRTTWNHEVQVRTADGDLLWRTQKTVRSVTPTETALSPEPDQGFEPPSEIPHGPVEPAIAEPAIGGTGGEETPPPMGAPEDASSLLDKALRAIEFDERPILEAVEPTGEEPASEEPASEEPTSEEPTSEEPTSEEPTSEEPTSEEPTGEEPTSEEPTSEEPMADEPASQSLDQPAEPEPQQPATGAPKPKKRRKGILRKLMFDDNYDQ